RRALAKSAGVPENGSGSHRLAIAGDLGAAADPDGFTWAAVDASVSASTVPPRAAGSVVPGRQRSRTEQRTHKPSLTGSSPVHHPKSLAPHGPRGRHDCSMRRRRCILVGVLAVAALALVGCTGTSVPSGAAASDAEVSGYVLTESEAPGWVVSVDEGA